MRISGRLGAATLIVLAAATGAEAQGLGEAARREKERRAKQTSANPQKTYTEADLAAHADPARSNAGPSEQPTDKAASRARVNDSSGVLSRRHSNSLIPEPNTEAYWRQRADQLKRDVEAAERKVRELEAATSTPLPPWHPSTIYCQEGIRVDPLRDNPLDRRERIEQGKAAFEKCKRENEERARQEQSRGQNRERAQAELPAARQRLESAREKLAGFEEEARRGGALPGWLR